jgi:hypothetical protein
VRLLLATRQLDGPGGAESYLLTVAEELRRLGHDVTFTATTLGPTAAGATAAGFKAVPADHAVDPAPDAILVQDRALSLKLAQRHPGARQLFVVHGVDHDYELPQPGVDVVCHTVVLNDRHAGRVAALDGAPALTRLRQPIDMRRFNLRGDPADRPRRALILSNNFPPARRAALETAWGAAGVEIAALGRNQALALEGQTASDPREQIAEADVVVGYGRAMLEAMACGRAAFVFAGPGGDGWVTEARYPAMEADGFAGGAFPEVYDTDRLRSVLADYHPELGRTGRDLVRFPHDSREHVAELARLLASAPAPGERDADRLRELERMVQMLWQAEGRVATLRVETARLYEELDRREWVERRLAAIESSRRYRIAGLLAKPIELLRRRQRG